MSVNRGTPATHRGDKLLFSIAFYAPNSLRASGRGRSGSPPRRSTRRRRTTRRRGYTMERMIRNAAKMERNCTCTSRGVTLSATSSWSSGPSSCWRPSCRPSAPEPRPCLAFGPGNLDRSARGPGVRGVRLDAGVLLSGPGAAREIERRRPHEDLPLADVADDAVTGFEVRHRTPGASTCGRFGSHPESLAPGLTAKRGAARHGGGRLARRSPDWIAFSLPGGGARGSRRWGR